MSFYNTANLPNSNVLPLGKPVAEWANVQHVPSSADISASVLANNLVVNQLTVNTLIVNVASNTNVNLPSAFSMWSMLGASASSLYEVNAFNSNMGAGDFITWKIINNGSGNVTFVAPNASQKVVNAGSEATLVIKWTNIPAVVSPTNQPVYTVVF